MLIWSRIIIQMENKTIGTSYMYLNETINLKHMYLNQPITINQKIKELV